MKRLLAVLLCAGGVFGAEPFLVKPYLQLGDSPKLEKSESAVIVWHTPDEPGNWSVKVSKGSTDRVVAHRVVVPDIATSAVHIAPHLVYTARISGLKPGGEYSYSVLKDSQSVFTASARARKSAKQDYRLVIFGDIAQGTPQQKQIAYQVAQNKPDAVFVCGDIVYGRGRVGEYRERFFPVYNADVASPETGAPLLRSTLFIAATGNHDTAFRDLTVNPDALAFYYYWRQPSNGVEHPAFGNLAGPEANQAAFRDAAGSRFPKAVNFSYDYGNAHWLVLDSNPYADWSDPALRKWVADDLAAAKGATWRFVGFHHPGFNSSKAHFTDQQMRVLSEVFEQYGVDVVFAGHVHNYQRSHPLKFKTKPGFDFKKSRVVDGDFAIDTAFDGVKNTKPKGVIYLVTGAGGAGLYDREQGDAVSTWQPFTSKFVSKINSMTVMDVSGKKATFKQVAADGSVVDSWAVRK